MIDSVTIGMSKAIIEIKCGRGQKKYDLKFWEICGAGKNFEKKICRVHVLKFRAFLHSHKQYQNYWMTKNTETLKYCFRTFSEEKKSVDNLKVSFLTCSLKLKSITFVFH